MTAGPLPTAPAWLLAEGDLVRLPDVPVAVFVVALIARHETVTIEWRSAVTDEDGIDHVDAPGSGRTTLPADREVSVVLSRARLAPRHGEGDLRAEGLR